MLHEDCYWISDTMISNFYILIQQAAKHKWKPCGTSAETYEEFLKIIP
jgi:hypothetical protein